MAEIAAIAWSSGCDWRGATSLNRGREQFVRLGMRILLQLPPTTGELFRGTHTMFAKAPNVTHT